MRQAMMAAGLAAATALSGAAARAQDADAHERMREVHAVLLGLAIDGEKPERDGGSDLYSSIIDNPNAPRLVTRLEVAINPCRARSISALQFPGQWASLTFALTDLDRISAVTAYASVDDMIAETGAIAFDDPRAQQIVLTGDGLYCSSRVPLSGEEGTSGTTCGDRLDLAMIDEDQRTRGLAALARVAETCGIEALRRK